MLLIHVNWSIYLVMWSDSLISLRSPLLNGDTYVLEVCPHIDDNYSNVHSAKLLYPFLLLFPQRMEIIIMIHGIKSDARTHC